MVVRYITKRFIGEYDPNLEKVYTFNTIVDSEVVPFEILDAAGQPNVINHWDCGVVVTLISIIFLWLLLFSRNPNVLPWRRTSVGLRHSFWCIPSRTNAVSMNAIAWNFWSTTISEDANWAQRWVSHGLMAKTKSNSSFVPFSRL